MVGINSPDRILKRPLEMLLAATLVFVIGGASLSSGQSISNPTPPAWLPEVDDILVAQNFPDRASASTAIGRLLTSAVSKAIPEANGIAVVAVDKDASDETLEAVRASLSAEFPGEPIRIVPARDAIRDDEIAIVVRDDVQETVLQARVQFPARLEIEYGRVFLDYDDKPWVNSKTKELEEDQRIVRSQRLADSPRDARQQCLDRALALLGPIFDKHARNVYQDRPEVPFDTHEAIRVALQNGQFTVDEFTQHLRTEDGTDAWRHAMLLTDTAMNELMISMNIKAHAGRNARHWRWLIRFGGLLGLLVCVSIVYLLLDSATKGYYAGWISATIAVFGIVALVLIYFRTMG